METGGMGARGEEVGGGQEREMGPGTGDRAEERQEEEAVVEEEQEGKKEVHFG